MSDSRLEAANHLSNYGSLELNKSKFIHYDFDTKEFSIEDFVPSYEDCDDEKESYISKVTAIKVLGLIKQYFERYPVVYVNAYAVNRYFAHPAEGGIWLDAGEPLASVAVRKGKDDIEAEKARLIDIFGPEYEGNRHRSSVIGETNLEIYVQDSIAEHFPKEPYVYQ